MYKHHFMSPFIAETPFQNDSIFSFCAIVFLEFGCIRYTHAYVLFDGNNFYQFTICNNLAYISALKCHRLHNNMYMY